ncbi:MAG: hypothetical protein M3R15_11415, partial [Acidobacteriota bacterium]|nr:hypothetical protein [Acidobacteriota bacterium]
NSSFALWNVRSTRVAPCAPLREYLDGRLLRSVDQREGVPARFVHPADHEPFRLSRGSRLPTFGCCAHPEESEVGREQPPALDNNMSAAF